MRCCSLLRKVSTCSTSLTWMPADPTSVSEASRVAVRNATRLASLTLVGSAGIHVKDVEQVDTFLSNEQQRIRDLFYDQELAEAVIASSERPEQEDAALKNRMITDRK